MFETLLAPRPKPECLVSVGSFELRGQVREAGLPGACIHCSEGLPASEVRCAIHVLQRAKHSHNIRVRRDAATKGESTTGLKAHADTLALVTSKA